MADWRRNLSEADLEQMMSTLGNEFEYPPTPDLATSVGARLRREEQRPAPVSIWDRITALRDRPAVAALLAVILLSLVIAAVPPTRSAVADWLGIRGVVIVEQTATPSAPLATGLNLGAPVTLADARDRADYRVRMPDLPRYADPDEVYVSAYPEGGQVAMVYRAGDSLPRAAETGVGLLFTQFRGDLNPNAFGKGVGPDTTIERVTVGDSEGLWISGEAHVFYYTDDTGASLSEHIRLAGNTLLWQSGDLTLRIESALTKDEAIRIAESVRAID